jgi:hypothetical protein
MPTVAVLHAGALLVAQVFHATASSAGTHSDIGYDGCTTAKGLAAFKVALRSHG